MGAAVLSEIQPVFRFFPGALAQDFVGSDQLGGPGNRRRDNGDGVGCGKCIFQPLF